jgi:hypothetical protein
MKLLLIVITLLLFSTPGSAFADYFQFFDGSGPYYITYARVTLAGKTIGYTDAYGRLKINLPRGQHQVEIEHRGQTRTARLSRDGGSGLKRAEAF